MDPKQLRFSGIRANDDAFAKLGQYLTARAARSGIRDRRRDGKRAKSAVAVGHRFANRNTFGAQRQPQAGIFHWLGVDHSVLRDNAGPPAEYGAYAWRRAARAARRSFPKSWGATVTTSR